METTIPDTHLKLDSPHHIVTIVICATLACTAGCSESDAEAGDVPAAAPPPVDTALAPVDAPAYRPAEIYFDLTAFDWYRQGRPLVHRGRSYMPESDPVPVAGELREAGRYEGVSYYLAKDAAEPVYTIYVPVYYRYWQRFTSPPGR